MELDTPPPSSQNPDSDLSRQIPPAQPQAGAEPSLSGPPLSTLPQEAIFQHLSTYPFHADQDYLIGLSTILGHPEVLPAQSELDANHDLVLQAQCFYFSRKASLPQPIDVEAYRTWLASRPQSAQTNGTSPKTFPPPRPHAPTPASAAAATTLSVQPHQQALSPQLVTSTTQNATTAEPTPPYPTSFADIVELITQNKPIPGIEEVPDTVLELGSSKRDTAVRRKKPWEKDEDDQTASAEPELDPLAARHPVDQTTDVEGHQTTGEGVVKILQPGAIPESGLIANE